MAKRGGLSAGVKDLIGLVLNSDDRVLHERSQKLIEITGNFLMGKQLSPEHYQSLANLLQEAPVPPPGKGTIYLSPLKDSPKKRELLPRFFEIKDKSRLPAFIYLIQRL
jgi:hypothetical protein